MNLKKQQLIAVSLAVFCATVLPINLEASERKNTKTGNNTVVVSSVPQPQGQRQVTVQSSTNSSRQVTSSDNSAKTIKKQNVSPKKELSKKELKAAEKAAKEKAKADKKREKEEADFAKKNKGQKTKPTVIATGGTNGAATTKGKAVPTLPVGYQNISIFGEAVATKEQAAELLKQHNPDLKLKVTAEEIVDIYWREAAREGVRQDLAFSQALVETGFFKFGGDVKIEQNNFCGLGTTGGGVKGAYFATPEIGARAHIQHLLAYTTKKHPSTKIVDPRYDLAHGIRLERGFADTWYKLNGTWAMSPNYSEKIMGVWQRMLAIEAVEDMSNNEITIGDKNRTDTVKEQHKMRDFVEELLKESK